MRTAKAACRGRTVCAAALAPMFRCLGHSRSGMTLIELLIVIVILATLTSAALPILTPSTTERRIREASRELNSYIAQAQAKAIATQRPYGIALKRLSSDTNNADDRGVCLEVFMVEQPAAYAGFDENSRARVALNIASQSGNLPVPGYSFPTVLIQFVTRGTKMGDQLPSGWDIDLIPSGMLQPCDVVEINGNRYELLSPDRTTSPSGGLTVLPRVNSTSSYYAGFDGTGTERIVFVAKPLNNTGQLIKSVADNNGLMADPVTGTRLGDGWILLRAQGATNVDPTPPYWTSPSAYKILRQPALTSAPPLQLPEAAAIDLEASGVLGGVPIHVDGLTNVDTPVYVMFSPEGAIERIQATVIDNRTPTCLIAQPTASVALLVGRRENIIPANTTLDVTSGTEADREEAKNQINWLNMESRWVTIGAQTGSVVTTENAFVNTTSLPTIDFDGNGDTQLNRRRTQIQAAQEFVREMRRLGGR